MFLVKNIGNKTAHPNIEPKQSLQIISTQKLLSEFNFESFEAEIEKFITENKIITTENIFLGEKESSISKPKNRVFEELISNDNDEEVDEDEHLYYHSNEYEFNNIKLNTKCNIFNKINQYINITKCQIEEKIRNIKNEQISRFNIGNLKKSAKIKEIMEVIFNENDESIFNETQNIIRVLNDEIDKVIKKVYNTNLEKNYFDEKENFKSIIELLRIIGMKLKDFEELKII